LHQAAIDTVPQKKKNFLKYWWDNSADQLKQDSISSHRVWVDNGRPRFGPIYDNKASCKSKYKSFIQNCKKEEARNVSDSLHDALINKSNVEFWKIWNNKFNAKNLRSISSIDGSQVEAEIADKFRTFFIKNQFYSVSNGKTDEELATNINHLKRDLSYCKPVNSVMIEMIAHKLSKGKAAGEDNITCENLQFCHPIVHSVIAKLFNLMFIYSYVPSAFGRGVIVPIPKGNKHSYNSVDDYRGITICSILSKVFEHCILLLCNQYLTSSDRQFGFKAKVGCQHALYTLNKVVSHFTNKGSTINLCSLDLTKAFERVSHSLLLKKLVSKGVPQYIVLVLANWYSKLFSVVRWGNYLSAEFNIFAGVRQGGVLSPFLFNVFVDDVLTKLENTKKGCFIKNVCANSLMYADDLLLLSITVSDLRDLVSMCLNVFNNLGMEINIAKSSCVRIGQRHNFEIKEIIVNNCTLKWSQEFNYLGVMIASAKKFTVNLQNVKHKFFKALNGIFGKVGLKTSPVVLCSLIEQCCMPILLYASESICWSSSMIRSIDNAYSQALFKIFQTFDKNVIKMCQYYMYLLPIELKIVLKKLKFFLVK